MHGAKHGKDSETPGMNTPGMNTTTKTTINSTPIRVNMEGSENNGDSNRSSTSSWLVVIFLYNYSSKCGCFSVACLFLNF